MLTQYYRPEDVKRNFRWGVLNGLLYITAETLLDPTLVIVAFLSHLTQSPLLLGLVVPMRDGAWSLPQLWMSGFMQSKPHKQTYYLRFGYIRIAAWIMIALTINLVRDPALLLVLFFAAYVLSSLSNGLTGLPFMELVAKTIPPERRGEFFAWRMGLGGVLGIGGSALVRWLLDTNGPLAFPYNFGALSIAFLVLGASSIFVLNALREPYDTNTLPAQNLPAQTRRAAEIVRGQPNYRRFLAMMSVMILSSSAAPFFAVYVQRVLGGSQAMIGYYLAAQTTANLAATILFGRLSRRWGNGAVMALGLCSGILMVGLVLGLVALAGIRPVSGAEGAAWLVPVFMLLGIRNSGTGIAWNSLLLDIAPEQERSLYVGFTNTILGVVLLLTGLSGLIVKSYGYVALFVFALLAHGAALWLGIGVIKATRPSQRESLEKVT